jgi:hypothetical protein
MKNKERIFKKYLAKREVIREGFCKFTTITTDLKIRSKWIYKNLNFTYLYSHCQEVIRLGRWSVVIPLSLLALLFSIPALFPHFK